MELNDAFFIKKWVWISELIFEQNLYVLPLVDYQNYTFPPKCPFLTHKLSAIISISVPVSTYNLNLNFYHNFDFWPCRKGTKLPLSKNQTIGRIFDAILFLWKYRRNLTLIPYQVRVMGDPQNVTKFWYIVLKQNRKKSFCRKQWVDFEFREICMGASVN